MILFIALIICCCDMNFQLVLCIKFFLTVWTGEIVFNMESGLVFIHFDFLRDVLVTVNTLERLLARMNAYMLIQSAF